MAICPAPANSGIKFRRMDIDGQLQTVIAHASYAEQARFCTRIVNSEGITLETIEHLMAAFAGVGLDNAMIEIDASEAPILDGSSQPVLDAFNNVGHRAAPSAAQIHDRHQSRLRHTLTAAHGRCLSRLNSCRSTLKSNLMIARLVTKVIVTPISDGSFATELATRHAHSANCGMSN
jgi:UDP-3-O-acyl-N-acetylglucosamine deacetylase